MDTTIKINLVNPAHRLAMRALLTALDHEQEKAEGQLSPAMKPQGRAPDSPAATAKRPEAPSSAAQPAPAAPPPAAEPTTQPVEGDGEAVLTAAQRDEVIRLQTERVQDVDQARAELKDMLQKCFAIGSLSQLLQKWLPKVEDYAKTGNQPDEIPFL